MTLLPRQFSLRRTRGDAPGAASEPAPDVPLPDDVPVPDDVPLPDDVPIPEAVVHTLPGWSLTTDLPTAPLVSAAGEPIGWLIGWAVAPPSDSFAAGPQTVPPPATVAPEAFEAWLYGHGGRYAAVLVTPQHARLYLDPAGSLAAVYPTPGSVPPGQPAAASTTTLLAAAARREPVGQPVPGPNFWVAGLTADPGARRLLPNHFLDLHTGEATRHHYRRLPDTVPDGAEEPLVRDVLEAARRTIMAAALWGERAGIPPALGLTGGQDSRMILAAAAPVARRLDLFTFDYAERKGAGEDVRAARVLARRFGLRHRLLPVSGTLRNGDEYLLRIGHAGGPWKAVDFYDACRDALAPHQLHLTGFAGEVGRAYYRATQEEVETPEGLVRFLARVGDKQVQDYAPSEEEVEAVRAWMRSFEWRTARELLDLAYLEFRIGSWASAHLYGFYNPSLIPLSHRSAFDAMHRLPTTYREANRLAYDVVRLGWPELTRLPFGPLTPKTILRHRVKRALVRTGLRRP